MKAQTLSAWQVRLGTAFVHDPLEYQFVDAIKCNDSCACGHPIKTGYIIAHKSGHTLMLGSDCIENFTQLSGIHTQVEAYLAKKKEEKKMQAEAEKSIELQTLILERNKLHKILSEHGYIPYTVYRIRKNGSGIHKVKTLKSKISKLKAYNKTLREAMSEEHFFAAV
jgi:hypothetical protein